MSGPSYWTLPRRGQILLLVLCRLTEPLAVTSIAPYLYYMIRDFGYTDPSTISTLVTLVVSAFSLGGALTGLFWGRVSDTLGRKPALLLGIVGTTACALLFGTARSFKVALVARLLAGMLSGNGPVMKTVIAEIIGPRKEFQSRAFAILPMTFNIGSIIGPVLGGLLADPARHYPSHFGDSAFFTKYRYILPNLVLLPILGAAFVCCLLFVEETGRSPQALLPVHRDPGLRVGDAVCRALGIAVPERVYRPPIVHVPGGSDDKRGKPGQAKVAGTSSIFTRPVLITLMCYTMLMFHCPTFMQLLPLFLSTPRIPDNNDGGANAHHHHFWEFNGGLGWSPGRIGSLMSVLGFTGILLQLTIYPPVAALFGNAGIHKLSLKIFPVAYALVPFLSKLPDSWTMPVAVPAAALVILARTFALPPMTILITNATPSRAVLGTVHGVASSVNSVAKCLGPFVLGGVYSFGVRRGVIGLAWWAMAAVVATEIFVSRGLKEWSTDAVFDEPPAVEEVVEDEDEAEQTTPLIASRGARYHSTSADHRIV